MKLEAVSKSGIAADVGQRGRNGDDASLDSHLLKFQLKDEEHVAVLRGLGALVPMRSASAQQLA